MDGLINEFTAFFENLADFFDLRDVLRNINFARKLFEQLAMVSDCSPYLVISFPRHTLLRGGHIISHARLAAHKHRSGSS